MDFNKITLTPDGMIYLNWTSEFGNTWQTWIEPELFPAFIAGLMRMK